MPLIKVLSRALKLTNLLRCIKIIAYGSDYFDPHFITLTIVILHNNYPAEL